MLDSKIRSIRYKLREYNKSLDFQVRICGFSAADSKPSIVAVCPKKLCSLLKKELDKDNLRYQYAAGVTPGLSFPIYYYPTDDDPRTLVWTANNAGNLIGREALDVNTAGTQDLTMCGTRVSPRTPHGQVNSPSSVTLSCLIEIKGSLHGLLPAHIVPKGSSNEIEPLYGTGCDEDNNYDDNDDDYDDEEMIYEEEDDLETAVLHDAYEQTMTVVEQPPIQPAKLSLVEVTLEGPGGAAKQMQSANAIYPGVDDQVPDRSDRDWAVAEIVNASQMLPNVYSADSQAHRYFPTEVASKQPPNATAVHILTSSSTKHGVMVPGFTSLGGLSGRGCSEVWNVSTDSSNRK